ALFARQPLALPDPTGLTSFATDDKAIAIQHPGNWKPHNNSLHDVMSELWFVPAKNCELRVSTDLAGSLMADIVKSSQTMQDSISSELSQNSGALPAGLPGLNLPDAPKRKSPLEQLHELEAVVFKKSH